MSTVEEVDPESTRIAMLAPDGSRYLVPSQNLDAAIERGWRPAPKGERQVGGQLGAAGSFLGGALSEATRGYSDIALTDPAKAAALAARAGQAAANPFGQAVDAATRAVTDALGVDAPSPQVESAEEMAAELGELGVPRETELGRDYAKMVEQNPTANILGRVTGGVGGALAGPGAVLARGASAIGKGAASAAFRGGTHGLLGRAAERGLGLGIAGAVEGAVDGYGHVVSEEALGDRELAAEEILAHVGGGALLGGAVGGALGAASPLAGAATRKFLSAARDQLDDAARKATLKSTGARPSDIARMTPAKQQQVAQDIRSFTKLRGEGEDGWRKILDGAPDDGVIAARLSEAASDATADLARIRGQVDDFAKKAGIKIDADELFRRVDDEVLGELDAGLSASSARKAAKVRKELSRLRKLVDEGESVSLGKLTAFRQELASIAYPKPVRGGIAQTPTHAREIAKTERVLEDFLQDETEKILSATGKRPERYAEARRMAESMIKARDIAEKAVRMDTGLRMFSLTDYIGGGGAGAIFGGPVGAVAGAVVNKVARERGPAQMAKLADRVGRLEILNRAARSTHSQINESVDTFIRRVTTKTKTADDMTLDAARGSVATLATTKFDPQGPEPEDPRKAAKVRASELRRMVANPDMLADRISAQLADVERAAPGVAQAMAKKGAEVAAFLASKAPQAPAGFVELPGQPEWLPSRAEASRFGRYVRAATQPLSTLDDLRRGRLSHEAVETLRALYPKIYNQARTSIVESLAENPRALSYSEKIHLSMLLDAPLDATMRPEFMRGIQQSYNPPPKQGQGPRGMRVTGLDNIELSGRMRTEQQQLEENL